MNRSLTEILRAPLDWVTRPFVERAMRRMHTYLEIANDAFITTEWVEFEPVESMRFERRYQEVYVSLRDCRMHTEKEGLILPDGTVVNPEVQIVDEFGEKHPLYRGSYGVMPVGGNSELLRVNRAGYSGNLPRDREYRSVLVRSDKPFRCSKIVWHNYNLK